MYLNQYTPSYSIPNQPIGFDAHPRRRSSPGSSTGIGLSDRDVHDDLDSDDEATYDSGTIASINATAMLLAGVAMPCFRPSRTITPFRASISTGRPAVTIGQHGV